MIKPLQFQKFSSLLDEFKAIKPSEIYYPSFLDISGNSHHEKSISNILSFYIQNDEVHGLSDLFLKSLVRCCGESHGETVFSNVEVKKEVNTDGGNYIDLLIECDDLVLCIENKIYHQLYNDLRDYAAYVDRVAKGKKRLKVLLSLYKLNDDSISDNGFINVTYEEFFSMIEGLIGDYFIDANQKYLNYLIDIIKTIGRLKEGTAMDKELMEYLADREDDVNEFLNQLSKVRKELRSKLEELHDLVNPSQFGKVKKSYYRQLYGELYDTMIYSVDVDEEFSATIDIIISPSGWYFDVYPNKTGVVRFDELMRKGNIELASSYTSGKRMLPDEFDYDVSLEDVASVVKNFLGLVSES